MKSDATTSSVLSMTGFGAAEGKLAEGALRVELRAVNHRHLDVRVRTPTELLDYAGVVEETIRAHASRGRVEAVVRWDTPTLAPASIDTKRVAAVYAQLAALRDEVAPGEPLAFGSLLSMPGIFATRARLDLSEAESVLRATTLRACSELHGMRAREGKALVADLRSRLSLLGSLATEIATQRAALLDGARQRMLKRIEKLLEGSGLEPDPGKLAQEVAWFAERSDIAEELTRLHSHLAEFERSLSGGSDGVGKKLDFLVQELGREVNTIGSKANDAGIAHRVVEMKAELERIREQVQNLL
ncbi:MAG: YicC/YloC family endoribonuclease [Myxococcales bacterium]